jgi:hypothetical protein
MRTTGYTVESWHLPCRRKTTIAKLQTDLPDLNVLSFK